MYALLSRLCWAEAVGAAGARLVVADCRSKRLAVMPSEVRLQDFHLLLNTGDRRACYRVSAEDD